MNRKTAAPRVLATAALLLAACRDAPTPTDPALTPADSRVAEAQFSDQELDRWFRLLTREALALPGAVFADLDEAAHHVFVGVEHGEAAAAVRGLAASLGVPPEALVVREVEPIRPMVTLRDHVRPVVGGVQIHFFIFLCTLGFNAVHEGAASFITNSHCTERQGTTDGTAYFQPVSGVAESFIGTEVDDPSFFRGGDLCPRGRRCRLSDAARAAYAPGVRFALGGIAATDEGSLTITGTRNISGAGSASVGATVSKVGRTTGTTTGEVTRSCVNTNVFASNITLICQTFVNAGVGAGDSGSPVFAARGRHRAMLLGILWGGSGSSLYVYSPIANIEQELGTLTTH
ncbi:MAG: hypothetical protein ACREMJ_09760 [Gemmatimonadales bacterium]